MNAKVDAEARRRLAELARHLASGQISNDDFEEALPKVTEPGIHDVYFYGLWPLYDDFVTHRLRGKRALTPEGRAAVARIVLFLRSGLPYRYPIATGLRALPALLLSFITLGAFGRIWMQWQRRHGDESVWPFFSRAEYERALRNPTYLNGPNCSTASARPADGVSC